MTKTMSSFRYRRVGRSQLRAAPYNPRVMSKHAMNLLREKLRDVGLVMPVIWNERTGNVVGGHQRLAALDALHDGPDYELDVAVVDLDEKTEREQNVFLNNIEAQGQWDLDRFGDLIRGGRLDIKAAGFQPTDLQLILPDTGHFKPSKIEARVTRDIEAAIAARKEAEEKARQADRDGEHYVVVLCPDKAARDAFLHDMHIPATDRMVSVFRFANLIGLPELGYGDCGIPALEGSTQ